MSNFNLPFLLLFWHWYCHFAPTNITFIRVCLFWAEWSLWIIHQALEIALKKTRPLEDHSFHLRFWQDVFLLCQKRHFKVNTSKGKPSQLSQKKIVCIMGILCNIKHLAQSQTLDLVDSVFLMFDILMYMLCLVVYNFNVCHKFFRS